jgi:AbrB family looped-hinge helix DNA binding protein
MRVTSKGQVTIPIDIRERLGIRPETEVEFEIVEGVVHLRVVGGPGLRGRAVVEALRGMATSGLTTDEILCLTRGEPAEEE